MTQGIHDDRNPREIDIDTGLPIGPRLASPAPATAPRRIVLEGRYARLEPLDPARHREDLHAASTSADRAARFRYMPELPPDSPDMFGPWLAGVATSSDPLYFAVIDCATGRAEGWQTLLRITPVHQCIEIGNIYWGPRIDGHPRRHRGNVPVCRPRAGNTGVSALRMEVRCPQRPVAPGRAAFRLHLRRATFGAR